MGPGAIAAIQREPSPASGNLTLQTPSLLAPGGMRAGPRPDAAPQLQLSPEFQALALQHIQQQLDPAFLVSVLSRARLGTPPPISPNLPPQGPAYGPPAPAGVGQGLPAVPTSPTPQPYDGDPGLREGGGVSGDLIDALKAVPEVHQMLGGLASSAGEQWSRLGPTGKVGIVSGGVAIVGGVIGGILADPGRRQWAITQLNGRVLPVPGVDWLHLEVNVDPARLFVGAHVDVGALLPPSWGFGPSPWTPQSLSASPANDALMPGQRVAAHPGEMVAPQGEAIGQAIRAAAGGGSPLEADTHATLATGLGADLRGVRIHRDGEADRLARAVDAVAFTSGQDIFFRAGTYDPHSRDGQRLLAHETIHTVQQAAGPVAGTTVGGGLAISDPADRFEREAEEGAARLLAGEALPQHARAAEQLPTSTGSSVPAVARSMDQATASGAQHAMHTFSRLRVYTEVPTAPFAAPSERSVAVRPPVPFVQRDPASPAPPQSTFSDQDKAKLNSLPNDPGAFQERGVMMESGDQPTYVVRVGGPGRYADHFFASSAEAASYAVDLAGSGEASIREKSALPKAWPNGVPGNPVDYVRVFEVPPKTPYIQGVVAPQPDPTTGRTLQGGGPQVAFPRVELKEVFAAQVGGPRGQRTGTPDMSPVTVESPVTSAKGAQWGAVMETLIVGGLAALTSISDSMQISRARSEYFQALPEIVQLLADKPGVGVKVVMAFLQPQTPSGMAITGPLQYGGLTWEMADKRTTITSAEKGDLLPANYGIKRVVAWIAPIASADKDAIIAGLPQAQVAVHSLEQFVVQAYTKGDLAEKVQVYQALKTAQQPRGPMLPSEVTISGRVLLVDSGLMGDLLRSHEGELTARLTKRADRLRGEIDGGKAYLKTQLDEGWVTARAKQIWSGGHDFDLDPHMFDNPEAHEASARIAIKELRFDQARESLQKCDLAVQVAGDVLFRYTHDYQRPGALGDE